MHRKARIRVGIHVPLDAVLQSDIEFAPIRYGLVGAFTLHDTVRFVFLVVLVLFTGCDIGGGTRLDHFNQGGDFFGPGPCVSPDGTAVLYSSPRTGNGDIYRVKIVGGATTQLTNDERYECDPDVSPNGLLVCFIREVEGAGRVHIMNVDGSGQRQLTSSCGDEGSPRFLPDSSAVVFWRSTCELRHEIGEAKSREIVQCDVLTGSETRLTENKVEDVFPVVAPDNKTLYFTRGDNNQYTMSLETSCVVCLGYGSEGSLSNDGRFLAVVGGEYGRQIDIMQSDGKNRTTLYSKNTRVGHPVFLPDGSGIAFHESTQSKGLGRILIAPLDGSRVMEVCTTW